MVEKVYPDRRRMYNVKRGKPAEVRKSQSFKTQRAFSRSGGSSRKQLSSIACDSSSWWSMNYVDWAVARNLPFVVNRSGMWEVSNKTSWNWLRWKRSWAAEAWVCVLRLGTRSRLQFHGTALQEDAGRSRGPTWQCWRIGCTDWVRWPLETWGLKFKG